MTLKSDRFRLVLISAIARTIMKRKMVLNKIITLIASIFFMAGTCPFVLATTDAQPVPLDYVGFIQGTDYLTIPFTITQPGQYETTLTDFAFPASFDSLQLAITTSTHLEGILPSPGTMSFEATPGAYYANIFGTAGGADTLGLFGIQVMLVPELQVWAAMLAGLIILSGYALIRENTPIKPTPSPKRIPVAPLNVFG